jgi:hypothetical protein
MPLVSYFFKAQAMGIIKEIKPDQLAMQFFGPMIMRRIILSMVDPSYLPIPVSSDEEYVDSIVENFLNGILVG